MWHRRLHDAGNYGSTLLRTILGEGASFPFPKSLYAVRDTLVALTRNKPKAVILDFFAGSGTTLHAVALMNAVDGGQRQCILVTNNEVSEEERKRLRRAGHQDGDVAQVHSGRRSIGGFVKTGESRKIHGPRRARDLHAVYRHKWRRGNRRLHGETPTLQKS